MYSAWKASEPFFLSWIQWCGGRYKSTCPTYYLVRGSFHYFIQAEMVYYLMNPLQFLNESPNYEWVKILREPGKGKSIMTTTEEDHRHLSKSQDHSPHILSDSFSLSFTHIKNSFKASSRESQGMAWGIKKCAFKFLHFYLDPLLDIFMSTWTASMLFFTSSSTLHHHHFHKVDHLSTTTCLSVSSELILLPAICPIPICFHSWVNVQ